MRFSNRAEFRAWLAENCITSGGVWLLFGKVGGPKTITANDVLEEALCFGWIDGQMQSLDDKTYKKYFSQRRENSKWSEKNKALTEKLEQQGIMTDHGREKIAEAKQNGHAVKTPAVTDEHLVITPHGKSRTPVTGQIESSHTEGGLKMDWITGIQRSLDYTEAHLTEKIDYEMVAKQAYSSAFHFQRVFSMLCGFSLGDYIRMRRLTLAAEDLLNSGDKIIDIALKYGYDTPESFSRAFQRFHGISPTEARRGGTIKSFFRLSVKLILSGGSTMDYRIERKDAFQIICKKKQVTKHQGDIAATDIHAFWAECTKDGTIEDICKYGRFDKLNGVLGVCFSGDMTDSAFPYGIGAEYNGAPLGNEGLEIVVIPAHTYAVFPCKGQMPEVFTTTYQRIVTEFFPQSNYEYGNGVELEVYPSAEVDDPNYTCEIWVAVNEKK